MSRRFFIVGTLRSGPLILEGPEAHHLVTVSRLSQGDMVRLFNGQGAEFPATVETVSRRSVLLRLTEPEFPQRELAFRIEVAAPLPKGDRGQFLVEKLTEIGVTRYVPLRTQRSVAHPAEARREKLERYVIEASKQCGRNILMAIAPVADWKPWCQRNDLPAVRILAHPGTAALSGTDLLPDFPRAACVLAIGPEGGFAEEEVTLAQTNGWHSADLGPRILRTETAAMVLAAWAAGVRSIKGRSAES